MDERGKRWLPIICNEAWEKEIIPKDWKNNLILPIHNKGRHTKSENYREICLFSVGYKFYTRIIEITKKVYRKKM